METSRAMLVNLQWTAQCEDPAARKSLVRYLRELATRLDDLAGLAPRHRVFDCLLQGRILIDGSLFGDTYPTRGFTQVGENVYLLKQLRLYGVQLWVIDPRKPELARTSRASFVFALDHGSVLDGLLVKVLGAQRSRFRRDGSGHGKRSLHPDDSRSHTSPRAGVLADQPPGMGEALLSAVSQICSTD